MIPVRLRLHNFMCYGEGVDPLDFRRIRLACLSGNNGNGKSALLDAITWVLWGKARARTEDELVRQGATHMEVEFDFMLGNDLYRVIRKRSLRPGKAASLPTLELQIQQSDGTWRPLTGNSIAETERRIVDLLHLDYETFVNSSLILQNRADEFTRKSPGERKAVLASILGLDVYDRLEEAAKERAREREQRLALVESEIRDIDAELAREPQYHAEYEQAIEAARAAAAALGAAEETLRGISVEKQALDVKAAQLHEIEAACRRFQQEVAQYTEQVRTREERIAHYEEIIARREDIERGYADLLAARAANEEMNRTLAKVAQLQEEYGRLQNTITMERSHLEGEERSLRTKAAELRQRSARVPALREQLAEVRTALADYEAMDQRHQEIQKRIQELGQELAALRQANESLKDDMGRINEKIMALANVTTCPLCTQPLSDEHRERVRSSYQQQMEEGRQTYRMRRERMQTLSEQLEALKQEAAEVEARLRNRLKVQRQEGNLERELAGAEEAAAALTEVEQALDRITQQLVSQAYAQPEQKRLAEIGQQIRSLAYDPTTHEALRAHLVELGTWEKVKGDLETALHVIDDERAILAHLRVSLQERRLALQREQERARVLQEALRALPEVAERLTAAQRAVEEAQRRARLVHEMVGAARQKLDHCHMLANRRAEKVQEAEALQRESTIYSELAVAFGKKGIQAMIIEEVTPQIQDEANAILGRMTDQRMHVRFESQRSTQKGNTIETLDIKISDELGTRSYEMFSGGEAFRANFAIRIALSKLLAHRAGARLQTLIIDEGFGTQDSQGRERLIDAITSIQEDFEKILVITHFDELKDAFPARIEVTKGPNGSFAEVIE